MSNRILGQFNSERVALGAATATLLNGVTATRPAFQRGLLVINNTTAATVFIGGSNVNDTNGLPVAAAGSLTVEAADGVYAYSVAGGNIQILEGF